MSSTRPSSKKNRPRKKTTKRGYTKAQQHNGSVIQLKSTAEFDRRLQQAPLAVVDFWAPWCGPCKAMGPTFERVAQAFQGQATFLKVNTETLPDLAQAFGIRSIPTLILLDGGTVVDSQVGLTTESNLSRMIQRALDRGQGLGWGDKLKRFFSKEPKQATAPPAV